MGRWGQGRGIFFSRSGPSLSVDCNCLMILLVGSSVGWGGDNQRYVVGGSFFFWNSRRLLLGIWGTLSKI